MVSSQKRNFIPFYILGLFFLTVFVYLNFSDRYRLFYLEQIQLFRYDWNYFIDFFAKPGGISEYFGAFLTQFFLFPGAGAAIITLLVLLLYVISLLLFKNYKITGVLWPILPVMMIVALHGDYLYKPATTAALLISLGYTLFCLSLNSKVVRHSAGLVGFVLLYNLTGILSFLVPLMLCLHEFFFSKNKSRYYWCAGYLATVIFIPWISWRFFYLLPLKESLLSPLPVFGKIESKIYLIAAISFVPVLTLILRVWALLLKKSELDFAWNWKNLMSSVLIIGILAGFIRKSSDPKTELILTIDYDLQHSNWEKALQHCQLFPEPHNLITFFSNIALLQSGKMGDQMFRYSQVGLAGLSLPWANNNMIPFFGCDIFYHLGYNNEAYRWAFEAMETNGECPRLLKRLALTSIINKDNKLAQKFLRQLQQSLFYKKWADHYLNIIDNADLLSQDREIKEKQELLIDRDFFVGSGKTPLCLEKLLENHHNKSAFEYYMAEVLLKKDLLSFVASLPRLKELGYKKIPVHYEEVILWYIGYSKQNVIPEGFDIRKSTLERFKNYLYTYSRNNITPELKMQMLKKEFGDTYWFYFHFNKTQNSLQ